MPILALGVSHRLASVNLLERLAFADDDFAKAYRRAIDDEAIDEAVVLSTCNRVEVYATVGAYHAGFLALKRLLCETRGIEPDELARPLYSHYEEGAAEHLFAVASGLDSMVLGEPQILSQVRDAGRRALAEGAARATLARLFESAVRTGRRVRRETGVGAAPDAFVAEAAAAAERALGGLAGVRTVVVGAGQMSALAVRHLRGRGVGPVRILNRSLERARALAERSGAEHDHLERLPEALEAADLVVSATGAAGVVIPLDAVRRAVSRRQRPLVIVDLAVPRDVDPGAAQVDGVHLVDLDGLKGALAARASEIAVEMERARQIVIDELHRFVLRRRSEHLAPLIRALGERGDAVVRAELERFRSGLAGLDPDQRRAVEALARGVAAKLLHDPIVRLKELSTPGSEEAYARMAAELFGIDPERA
ncbi:MAG TPA: glutamyl-tRNA reductase [Actinomycetota bacterium]|nr:glutamyl-tRNA reductase [Actinomycetota bacterium]